MQIHQYIPYLHGPGDAAADQVFAFQSAFRAWGYDSEIFALDGAHAAAGRWHQVAGQLEAVQADALAVYHYVIGSPLTSLLRAAGKRLILYYQNLTPATFAAAYHRELALALQSARDELASLRDVPALVPSEYSRAELLALGFQRVDVVPLLMDMERLRLSARTASGQALIERYQDGVVNWLSVGRIAPNKCCEDTLKAFAYYQRWINPRSRLFLVGAIEHFSGYQFNVARICEPWSMNDVHWVDRVDYADGFGAYYQLASVLIHMSEHEGFCAPLIEAMAFDVPVVAYKAAAVPGTLASAGVLIRKKRFEHIAEMVDLLEANASLRTQLLVNQRRRLADFSMVRVLELLRIALQRHIPDGAADG
jgi:L-malate glycosyltransferase